MHSDYKSEVAGIEWDRCFHQVYSFCDILLCVRPCEVNFMSRLDWAMGAQITG